MKLLKKEKKKMCNDLEEKEILKIKIMPKEVGIGDVLFSDARCIYDYINKTIPLGPNYIYRFDVKEELTIFPFNELIFTSLRGFKFAGRLIRPNDRFDYIIKNEDIREYGLKTCLENRKYYKIDYEYYEKCNKIEELKSIKDIKQYLLDSLKDE